MNKSSLLPLFVALSSACASASAGAAEVGRVISSQPAVQTVGVPRQVCTTEPMLMDVAPTGGGALAGAAIGGLAGNAIGSGGGRALATMLGVIAGSVIGDQAEASQPQRLFMVEYCAVQNFTENRTVGYDVEYEYAGKRYTARLAQPPGSTLPIEVTPAGSSVPIESQAPVVTAPPVAIYPQPVYAAPYPVYAPRPYPYYVRPPVSIGLGFTYIGGHR